MRAPQTLVTRVLAVCACSRPALAWFGTRHVALLRQGALLLDDFRLAYFSPPREQRNDVVILTIDEATLSQFPFRSPINRRLVAELVQTLSQRKVRALGIDLIFDQPTNAEDDRALLAALDAFAAPAVIAIGDAANGLTPRQLAFQEQFLAGRNVGLAGMLMTGGVVRHIYPGELRPEGWQPSFAAALAMAVGREPPRRAAAPLLSSAPRRCAGHCGAFRRNTSQACRLPGSRTRSCSSVPICRIRTRFARRCRWRKAAPSCPGSSFTRRRSRSCSTA